jgi:DNA primase
MAALVQTLSIEQRNLLREATMRYMDHLPDALPYLEKRGITAEAAERNGLGVVVNPVKGHEHLRGRLAIPYLTDAGPVNMTFRCIKDHDCKEQPDHHKYMRQAGLGSNLYGVQAYEAAGGSVSLCEGELDTLVLNMCGTPAMGVPGADNWQPHWTSILQDFSVVYIFSDGDTAGQKFAKSVMIHYENAVNVPMPSGMDVNEAYLKFGKEFLLGKIRE